MLSLSIVIPAYNECDRLPQTLELFLAYLNAQTYHWQIIVVDDGSTDHTGAIVASLAEQQPQIQLISLNQNQGKGAAVKCGVLASEGDRILFSDADGSTPITELDKLQTVLDQGIEIAIGNRRNSAIVVRQPPHRLVIGEVFNWLARVALQADIRDTQCGFKLLQGKIGRQLFSEMQMTGFSFDVELLYLAIKAGYQIAEVPVVWVDDKRSKVKVWRDPILVFIDLIRIRLLHG
ncbi:MAG: glycosyltransferase family 2 protein [Pseudanabaenaceae cyanobacterium bins.68]|nr:glycosyltransferase family 2 protein [Pseudanabaenaceae cyanobacterium bins.68]